VQVGGETTRNGMRPVHIVRGRRRSIEVASPEDGKIMAYIPATKAGKEV
jgi:hypothetical protein